jgi:rod shape-determining protein MreB
MWKTLDQQYGIDLGTSTTYIYQQGKGLVLHEPTVLAIHKDTRQIEAIGKQAEAMVGRTPQDLEVIYPIQDGVIANFDLTVEMLRQFIRQVQGRAPWLHRPQIVISVPCDVTNVKKRAVEDSSKLAGAKKVSVVEEPLAAAIGAGLPIHEPVGNMIVTIGGGSIQTAIISLGGIVVSHSMQQGGIKMDQDIVDYIRKTYNLTIGKRTAEQIKKETGTATLPQIEKKMEVRGRDLVYGLPKSITVTNREIYHVLGGFVEAVTQSIKLTLEKCPPELAGDILERGILLCGGGALLEGLGQRIHLETDIPIQVADQPLECVALGTGRLCAAQSR